MKYFLLLAIECYWLIVPARKRRTCLFKKSCSDFVYENTLKHGFFIGLKALRYRYKNCRSGYTIFINAQNGSLKIILPNNDIIAQDDISNAILKRHHTGA